MKYIRTKNSIYQVESVLRDNGFVKGYNVGEMAFIRKDQVIKQSDSIEELCDCIIETKGHTGDYFHYTYTAVDEPSQKRLLEDMINQDYEVYYAIWTSKGLIYVAKMNENGDLELI